MIPQKLQKLNILLILQDQKGTFFSLHYNGSNNFLFVSSTKIYQFKAKNSDIIPYSLCLGNICSQ